MQISLLRHAKFNRIVLKNVILKKCQFYKEYKIRL